MGSTAPLTYPIDMDAGHWLTKGPGSQQASTSCSSLKLRHWEHGELRCEEGQQWFIRTRSASRISCYLRISRVDNRCCRWPSRYRGGCFALPQRDTRAQATLTPNSQWVEGYSTSTDNSCAEKKVFQGFHTLPPSPPPPPSATSATKQSNIGARLTPPLIRCAQGAQGLPVMLPPVVENCCIPSSVSHQKGA